MSDMIEYKLSPDSEARVLVQTVEGKRTASAGLAGRGVKLEDAEQTFAQAMEHVHTLAEGLLDRLTTLASRPDRIDVEFGVALGAKAGVILTSGSVDANFKISLGWEKPKTA